MKVWVLRNSDDVIMGIFSKKSKADRMAVTIGQNRWHEAWIAFPIEIDKVDPLMLAGSESYRKMLKTLESRIAQQKAGK